mmetsp:Transcript_38948/g.99838  ORF Transcript_38948/g.99838 Transcript_38948/m.99838 type:complete len:118 (-) Transcript_38948:410-763(-)|eukprot:CAMPEP_0113867844 /NCGR_PEP_ID=MMETSP0780_2-20120614/648_1 /TAXON_ID=652834 /ORGANISM="Palpitomonas bilix" /LENGTH=117 /DNA_ID=CAMNT_0000852839 /DNA_START=45 /DNA_END=398 /DNA_ORIENTATION=+ /assembly_acc=CAM_ASM_000599
MPSLNVTVNVDVGESQIEEFSAEASPILAEVLEKPEQYIMVVVIQGHIRFGGDAVSPAALASLTSIGRINNDTNKKVSEKIGGLLQKHFGVSATRYYLSFNDIARENMGYNLSTFAK